MADEPQKNDELQKAKAAVDDFKGEIKQIEFEGFKFEVNTDMLDDVEIVDLVDRIENKQNLKAIVEFLHYLIGVDSYNAMKEYFVKKDGRFRLTTLSKIYYAIFEQFSPKG